MVLSNFVLIDKKGKNDFDPTYFAEVTVTITTGILWWKQTHVVRRKISRTHVGMWFFLDDGKYTPGFQAEDLERSYRACKILDAA
jgi:hypothetical protein